MEHGLMPQLSIRPNPNQGAASITSSISLGDASVEVVDMLGRIYQRTNILLNKEMPVQLELGDLHTGSYYLRVRSQGLRYQLPVAIIR
jgi:hypothetical protein